LISWLLQVVVQAVLAEQAMGMEVAVVQEVTELLQGLPVVAHPQKAAFLYLVDLLMLLRLVAVALQ
jgi:hypothetical protein